MRFIRQVYEKKTFFDKYPYAYKLANKLFFMVKSAQVCYLHKIR